MKLNTIALFLLLTLPAVADKVELELTLDRPDGIYAAGDTARITIRHSAGTVSADWTGAIGLTQDLSASLEQIDWDLAENPKVIEASIDEPGQLNVTAIIRQAGEKQPVAGKSIGMLFSPEEIQLSTVEPDDFDAFWSDQVAAWRKKVGQPQLTPLESGAAGIELYDIQIPITGEVPVSGLLTYPAGAEAKSLPAVLSVHGAGAFRANRRIALELAADGFLTIDINPHGLPNDQPGEYYKNIRSEELHLYRARGLESRDTFYFQTMFLRVISALDTLADHPLWNGEVLLIRGSSQGGAQALAGAALHDQVTAVAVNVPAMCDLAGPDLGRRAGWPNPQHLTRARDFNPSLVNETIRYYDMGLFARRITIPVFATAGMIDNACPAYGIQAMANNLQGPVKLYRYPAMGHEAPTEILHNIRAFLKEHAE